MSESAISQNVNGQVVTSHRLIGATTINGVTINDGIRKAIWREFGGWSEDLPSERRAAIEASISDDEIADITASGLFL